MKKVGLIFSVLAIGLLALHCSERTNPVKDSTLGLSGTSGLSLTKTTSYPWQDHASPYDFLFGNHIDTHQQSQILGNRELQGFFYITFTGNFTPDGYPEAMHGNCNQTSAGCTVGWVLHGIPIRAKLVNNQPGEHPTWCVDPADMPNQPGYTHFHWLDPPEHAHYLIVGKEYDGFLLKLTAVDTFFFLHQSGFLVTPGIDYVTHANIVTSCP